MYRKDVNERSPFRLFERSIHGGLGRGNIGVVLSWAGAGKSVFLVAVALDDLMRGRKVLHVNTRHPAERVREYYEEIFHELAESSGLENRTEVLRDIERNRRIHSFIGNTFSLDRLAVALDYMTAHAEFDPSAIVLDGFPDWSESKEADLKQVKQLAVRYDCEIWLSGLAHREGEELDPRGIPVRIAKLDRWLSVIVRLDAHADHIRLRLVKDHDNPDVADLHLELDPATLLVRWQ